MRAARRFAGLALVAALCGCGAKERLHPVEGKLFIGGQPAANAKIAFHPLGGSAPRALIPVGVTRPDGSYSLMCRAPGDGAPAGEYVVTLIWPDVALVQDECVEEVAHDRLKGRYADAAKSPLRATVAPGRNDIPLRAALAGSWSMPRLRDSSAK